MELLYHGTDHIFSKFDLSKSIDQGIYFTDEKNAAAWYGENIITVTLNTEKVLDLTSAAGALSIFKNYPALQAAIEEEENEKLEEIININSKYLSDSVKNFLSDCGRCFENENGEELFVREYLLNCLKNSYDCIKFEDYTDGDYHTTYIVFDPMVIQYLN